MSDLEIRLRHDLDEHAAGLDVRAQAPPRLLARVRRRRRARRTGMAAATASFVVIALVALLPMLEGGDGRARVVAGPPPSPPSLAGSIVANGVYPPGAGELFRFDLGAPSLVEGAGGDTGLAKVLPDGRLLTLAPVLDEVDGSYMVIRTVDPRTGDSDDRQLPRDILHPAALAVGPDGTVAVLNTTDGQPGSAGLFFLGPDGEERRQKLSFATDDAYRVMHAGRLDMSWGAGGLIALSAHDPEPLPTEYYEGYRPPDPDDPQSGWTNIVDAATGGPVAFLDGWQGLAWSPDGRGLLTARRLGEGASELAVWWGPRLEERIDVGQVPVPVVPRYWAP